MSLSGKSGFSKAIVKEFDTPHSLKTYRGERNPSVSANCNALLSLLVDGTEFEGKPATIKKIVAFIFDSWAEGKGEIKDKWNLSPHYTSMLMSRCFVELFSRWSSGGLPTFEGDVVVFQIVPLLLRCLSQTMATQRSDGAWGSLGPFEETAYAVLALISLLSLPLPASLSRKAILAIETGRAFLLTRDDAHCEFLWIEKITYGSKHLMDTYVLTALNASSEALCRHQRSAVLSSHDVEMEELLLVHGEVERMASAAAGHRVRAQS